MNDPTRFMENPLLRTRILASYEDVAKAFDRTETFASTFGAMMERTNRCTEKLQKVFPKWDISEPCTAIYSLYDAMLSKVESGEWK